MPEALEKKGHTAYYIAPEDPAHSRIEGLRTILYRGLQIPGQNYRLGVPDWSYEFRRTIHQIPFDILHIHSPFLSARVALEIQKANPKVPIVATFHSKYYDDAMKITHSRKISGGVINLVLSVYNKCDAVWAVNHETAQVLRAYGYRGEIDIAPNGTDVYEIDYDRAREARERLGIPENRKVLLFVGQIDRKKNIPSILRAAALLKKEGLDFVLLLAGEGPDRGNLDSWRRSWISRTGWRSWALSGRGTSCAALYALADLFVFPSIYDNAPMVVREAAVNETPSVLVRGSCSAEGIVDGENGFLCEDSPEDIARAIREGLPRAKEAGAAARRTIPKPWDEIMTDVIRKVRDADCPEKSGTDEDECEKAAEHGLVVASIVLVISIAFSNSELEDAWKALESLSPVWVLGIFGCWFAYMFFDALSGWIYLRSEGFGLSLGRAVNACLIGFYYSNITPSSAGGQPMQVNSLRKAGVPVGYGTMTATVRFICNQTAVSVLSMIFWLLNRDFVARQLGDAIWLARIGWLISFAAVPLFLMAAFQRNLIQRLALLA